MAIVKGKRSLDFGNYNWAYFKKKVVHSDVRQSRTKKILASILAIFAALLIAIIIACSVCKQWPNFGKIFGTIFTSGFADAQTLNTLLSNTGIMLVAGLAFIFAYKAGQFNIGISGQMFFGGLLATMISHMCHLGPGANQVVVLLASMVGGAFIAGISGLLKALLNVNEVVSSIMLNWIVYYAVILCISTLVSAGMIQDVPSHTFTVEPDSSLLLQINGSAFGPLLIIGGIVLVALIIVLNYTVFGKKQKVVGLSRSGALASGYNVKAHIVLSMAISGAISGILGAMVYAGFSPQMPTTAIAKAIPQEGFNGISVGLIAMCSPVAAIPVSFFFSMVQSSVPAIQSLGIDSHIANVVFGIVVYGSAAIALFLSLKPYWWTLDIFKGKNFSKIKHEKNQSEIALLELANDYNELLRKNYLYKVKNIKVKSSMKITRVMKAKMALANVQYHWINFWYGKIRRWDDMQMATLRSLSNIQNRRNGLQFRYDVANQNQLDLETLKSTQNAAKSLGLPEITNYGQYRIARDAFIKAYFLTSNEILRHYNEMFKKFAPNKQKGKKIVFQPEIVKFDAAKIEQSYKAHLIKEIKEARAKMSKPATVKADVDATGVSIGSFWKGA